MGKIGVFGLGNVLRQDDGFGPAVLRRLEARYDFPGNVELRDLGTPGLDLAGYIAGFDLVILADTISGGLQPGEIAILDATDETRVKATLRVDTHSAGLREALFLADLHGHKPERVVLVGTLAIELEQDAGLSVPVETAVEAAVEQILELLAQEGVRPTPRTDPAPGRGWWEAPGIPHPSALS